jgi:hypothetical protein
MKSRGDERSLGRNKYLCSYLPPTVTESYVFAGEFLIKVFNELNVKKGTDLKNTVWQGWGGCGLTLRM